MDDFFAVLVGISVWALILILAEIRRVWRSRLSPQRLKLIQRREPPPALPLKAPRVPGKSRFTSWVEQFVPLPLQTNHREELLWAGWQDRLRPLDFLFLRGFLMLALPFLGWFLLAPTAPSVRLAATASLLLVGWYGPVLLLRYTLVKRARAIEKTLPFTLDMLLVNTEAGLGFDGAVQRATQQIRGPLKAELDRLLGEMKRGKSRQEAWQGLRERIPGTELNAFAGAIMQASQLELSLMEVLRDQADLVRQKRRGGFESQARKMPIKILFALIFLTLPAMFIILGSGVGILKLPFP